VLLTVPPITVRQRRVAPRKRGSDKPTTLGPFGSANVHASCRRQTCSNNGDHAANLDSVVGGDVATFLLGEAAPKGYFYLWVRTWIAPTNRALAFGGQTVFTPY